MNPEQIVKYKRIWFKPDCRQWILEGKKTTTFRSRKHEGLYEIDLGSRFKPKPSGIKLRLIPMEKMEMLDLVTKHFATEGDFGSILEFNDWLQKNRLILPTVGWLHRIEILEVPK